MPRARLRKGRQPQEIGAAIVESWFKVLPTPASIRSANTTGPTLVITINRKLFAANDRIALRTDGNTLIEEELEVQSIASVPGFVYDQQLTIRKTDGSNYQYTGGNLAGGLAIPNAPDQATLQSELEAVLEQIIDAPNVQVVYDTDTEIKVAVPKIPDGVLTRGDLLTYLETYHDYGQGHHYHDELGVAVLFGCR
jgi:hypothetical protein